MIEQEIIHYISPKPEDIHRLMDGLLPTHKRMKLGMVPPIVHAAIISYGFVFLHPFEDGNGRIHQLFIHNILSLGNLFPHGLMFPISVSMLQDSIQYDASLEAFSRPLLQHIKYTLDALGHITVENETAHWYQYIEMTSQAEALYKFVQTTLEEILPKELSFLDSYTKTKQSIKNILDMPDHLIDLFIHLCLQNNGTLSQKKRAAYFAFLSEEEISNMEKVIREEFKYENP
ncbi:MAG: Fic family protein [Sphaerochaetaceae bacterium]